MRNPIKNKHWAAIAARVEKHKERIAKERDALRAIIEYAEEIATNCDEAVEELTNCVRNIEDAADSLSKYL